MKKLKLENIKITSMVTNEKQIKGGDNPLSDLNTSFMPTICWLTAMTDPADDLEIGVDI